MTIQHVFSRVCFVCLNTVPLPAGYRISWEEFNRTNTRVTHYLPNLTQEYKVTGLTALTTYTIQVAAMTSKGQGQLSASTISSGVPPGQMNHLTLMRVHLEVLEDFCFKFFIWTLQTYFSCFSKPFSPFSIIFQSCQVLQPI